MNIHLYYSDAIDESFLLRLIFDVLLIFWNFLCRRVEIICKERYTLLMLIQKSKFILFYHPIISLVILIAKTGMLFQ